jgi:hypothetical protein
MEVERKYMSIKSLIHYKGNEMTRNKIPTIKILLQTTGGSKWRYMVVRMTFSKQDL